MHSRALIAQAGNLAVLCVGAAFVLGAATGLDLGTPRRLGPGAFPLMAGICVIALALCSILIDLRRAQAPARADAMAVLAVAGAMAGFALLSPLAGVLPATFWAALAASLAARRPGWLWRLILACVLTGLAWLLFIRLLQVPFIAFRGL